MAITSSAKKEIRSSARRRVFNLRRLRTMRSQIKKVAVVHKGGESVATREEFRLAQKAIDKACKRGVIKKRTASRKKSRLSRSLLR